MYTKGEFSSPRTSTFSCPWMWELLTFSLWTALIHNGFLGSQVFRVSLSCSTHSLSWVSSLPREYGRTSWSPNGMRQFSQLIFSPLYFCFSSFPLPLDGYQRGEKSGSCGLARNSEEPAREKRMWQREDSPPDKLSGGCQYLCRAFRENKGWGKQPFWGKWTERRWCVQSRAHE